MSKVCVLASGGVDSAMLLAERLDRGDEVFPLYVRCGFRWERAELLWLRRLLGALSGRGRLRALTVAEAPERPLLASRHWGLDGRGVPPAQSPWESVYLPGRNLILLSEAGVFCAARGIDRIDQAILKGNPFKDATPRFRRAMEAALREGLGARIRIEAPYANLTKEQALRRASGVPLEKTFSCLSPKGFRHCGRCSKCEERDLVLERPR